MDTDTIEQRENYPDHQIGFDTVIKTAHNFFSIFPYAEILEWGEGCTRWSNGEGENTPYESVWICDHCEMIADLCECDD